MTRLGIFMSHPIQYQIGLLKKIAQQGDVDLLVNYYWDFGVEESYDPEFGNRIKWDFPLLEGYKYRFIRNYAQRKSTSFFGCVNPGVMSHLFRKEFDVVLIFGWALFSNWLVILAAVITRTPVLLCSESPLSHEASKVGIQGVTRRCILKMLFFIVDGFIYIGKENRLFYDSFGISSDRLFFSPYAVDNARHMQKKLDAHKNSDKKLPVKILFVGKLIEKKRPMDLLIAFHRVQAKLANERVELWFVGSGPQQIELSNYVEKNNVKNVVFWGFQNQTKLPGFYAEADIFVLPSGHGETWGLVVNEAMCHGKPIIVSSLVGCGQDLVTEGNGFKFPFKDIHKLSEALECLIMDSDLRDQYGVESFKIIQGYSHKIAAAGIVNAAKYVTSTSKG
jgi:glycosyltransferase involved in cell wall biosynthesis